MVQVRDNWGRDQKSWLRAIGQQLRAEYDAQTEPVPDRLAEPAKQIDRRQADPRP